MRKTIVLSAVIASCVIFSSLAWGAAPLAEQATGSYEAHLGGTTATFSLTGTVRGTPVSGTFVGILDVDFATLTITRGCASGEGPATANVTLQSGGDHIVKAETGTFCANGGYGTFKGTYTIDPSSSTGIYAGMTGSGPVTMTLTQGSSSGGSSSGTFTSSEGAAKPPAPPKGLPKGSGAGPKKPGILG